VRRRSHDREAVVTGAVDHPRSGGPHLPDIDQTDGLSLCVPERTVVYVTSLPEPSSPDDIVTDLVEYLVLVLPGPHALPDVGPELVRTVKSSAVRVLDVVVVNVGHDGKPETLEVDDLPSLAGIRTATSFCGVLLSRHDIELVSLALQPGQCAVVLVAEDRWAGPLAAAAHAAGGEVRAGERISRERVEAALARAADQPRAEW
jgi:Family of unknown function (DUF6325)